MNLEEMGENAGQLIAWGLRARARPAREPQYDQLLGRYRTDAQFRILVGAMADGLGLRVLGSGAQGLVLGATEDSVFALRLRDYRQNLSVEDRLVHGLVQVAIAAWAFPKAADLHDDASVVARVSVNRVESRLRALSEELEAQATEDPAMDHPELREAWRAVLAKPSTRDTPDSRRTATSLSGMIEYALEKLEGAGLMKKVSPDHGGTWTTQSAYRVHVKELAAFEAYRLIQAASRETSA
jgi:hypothetical protein